MSVMVHRFRTCSFSKKQDIPQPRAQLTPLGSLVKLITPYLTRQKSVAFAYCLSNIRFSHSVRDWRLREPELLFVSNWLRQWVSLMKNSMCLRTWMWMMMGAWFSIQNSRFSISYFLYPSFLTLSCRDFWAPVCCFRDLPCMYRIAFFCNLVSLASSASENSSFYLIYEGIYTSSCGYNTGPTTAGTTGGAGTSPPMQGFDFEEIEVQSGFLPGSFIGGLGLTMGTTGLGLLTQTSLWSSSKSAGTLILQYLHSICVAQQLSSSFIAASSFSCYFIISIDNMQFVECSQNIHLRISIPQCSHATFFSSSSKLKSQATQATLARSFSNLHFGHWSLDMFLFFEASFEGESQNGQLRESIQYSISQIQQAC